MDVSSESESETETETSSSETECDSTDEDGKNTRLLNFVLCLIVYGNFIYVFLLSKIMFAISMFIKKSMIRQLS